MLSPWLDFGRRSMPAYCCLGYESRPQEASAPARASRRAGTAPLTPSPCVPIGARLRRQQCDREGRRARVTCTNASCPPAEHARPDFATLPNVSTRCFPRPLDRASPPPFIACKEQQIPCHTGPYFAHFFNMYAIRALWKHTARQHAPDLAACFRKSTCRMRKLACSAVSRCCRVC